MSELRDTLSRAYQRFSVLERAEKCCLGVTLSQCMTLDVLLRGGRLTVRDLAAELGLDTSTVTRLVDVLERDSVVSRQRDEQGDRRRVFISLTDKGRDLATRLQSCADAYCQRILERVPAEQRSEVLAALRTLVEAIDSLPAACA